MKLKQTVIAVAAAALALSLTGCTGDYSKVEQGRVVAFDQDKQEVTLIHDSAMDPQHPVYDVLPPSVFKLPTDPAENGPPPKAGQRMKLDVSQAGKEEVVIFDARVQKLVHIPIHDVDVKTPIEKTSPLVKDKEFPIIDREKGIVTIYSSRQKMLCTFTPPAEYLDYPSSIWDAGDEVRLTYKMEGQALRFMNISKTDIFKR